MNDDELRELVNKMRWMHHGISGSMTDIAADAIEQLLARAEKAEATFAMCADVLAAASLKLAQVHTDGDELVKIRAAIRALHRS